MDGADPLAGFRERFVIGGGSDDPVAYLDGNSLGRLPRATAERMRQVVEHEWGIRLIRGWADAWLGLPERVGDLIGSAVLGAGPGQVVVADSTSINIAKVLHAAAALRPDRRTLVAARADFPTDRYLVQAVAGQRGMQVAWLDPGRPQGDALADVLRDDVAAVLLSHVDYRSAEIADLPAVTTQVHDAAAVMIWDLSHSAGSVPLALDAERVDLAVGCTYKYLNAGPGAPAFLYAATRHHDALAQPLPGWIGASDVFAMSDEYVPAPGIRRMLSGSPAVLGLVGVEEGVRLVAEAGIEGVRAKAVTLTSLLIDLTDAWLAPYGVEVASPRDAARRGAHVVLRHPQARRMCDDLAARGVVGDFRNPDLWRLGLSPLTTTHVEVWHAVQAARDWLADS
ncbi:MAG: aminotransferase class V-fold PLP-dependent enzyme [Nocardioidaceae bacterium]|nr:aminotransferase class V-fold PLP-dependent enzyme [Nocardioidaceae bacterium]